MYLGRIGFCDFVRSDVNNRFINEGDVVFAEYTEMLEFDMRYSLGVQ